MTLRVGPKEPSGVSAQTLGVTPVGFLKNLAGAVAVGQLLGQCIRVPFAAMRREEVTAAPEIIRIDALRSLGYIIEVGQSKPDFTYG